MAKYLINTNVGGNPAGSIIEPNETCAKMIEAYGWGQLVEGEKAELKPVKNKAITKTSKNKKDAVQ